jgi:uncharacterized protein YecT (DUF1311 family)
MVNFKKLTAALCFFSTALFASQFAHAADCGDAKNQMEMNACFCSEFKKTDAELNQVYQQVMAKYKADAAAIKRIKTAQIAWLAFRDANLESSFPADNHFSAAGMCVCNLKAEMTAQRLTQLQGILNPSEGDTCTVNPSVE